MGKEKTAELIQKAIDEGKIVKEALTPAMDQVNEEYEKGDRYVSEMLISAEAMKAGMGILRPLLAEADVEPAGKVVIDLVEGDLRDIGPNLVSLMSAGAGFEVHNLEVKIPAADLVEAFRIGQRGIPVLLLPPP